MFGYLFTEDKAAVSLWVRPNKRQRMTRAATIMPGECQEFRVGGKIGCRSAAHVFDSRGGDVEAADKIDVGPVAVNDLAGAG